MTNIWMLVVFVTALRCELQSVNALPMDQMIFNEFFYSIPEEDREDFLVWQLGIESHRRALLNPSDDMVPALRVPNDLKIDKETFSRLEKLDVPGGFSTHLYGWVRGAYGVSSSQIVSFVLTRKMCLRGQCFDIGDVGSICCPF